MFDIAAEIKTNKTFDELTVPELVEAMRQRLDRVLLEDSLEAFGFCDESEEEPCKPKAQSAYYTLEQVNGYDSLEVHTAVNLFDDTVESLFEGDEIPDLVPLCWGLYGHTCDEGMEYICDFPSFEVACEVAEKLGGKPQTS